jgi:hypothetical protein
MRKTDTHTHTEREREKREQERDEFTYPLLPKRGFVVWVNQLANPSLVPWFKILNLFSMLLTMGKSPIYS